MELSKRGPSQENLAFYLR